MQWWHKGLIKTQLHVILKSGEFTFCKLSIPSFIICGFGTRVGELHPARVRGRHLPTRARDLARVQNAFPALSMSDTRYLSTRSGCVSALHAGVERTVGSDPVFFFGMMMHLSQAPNNQGLLARCPSFPSTTTLQLILPVRGLAVTLPYVTPSRAEPGAGYLQHSDALRGPLSICFSLVLDLCCSVGFCLTRNP